jgi:hypothetical protein
MRSANISTYCFAESSSVDCGVDPRTAFHDTRSKSDYPGVLQRHPQLGRLGSNGSTAECLEDTFSARKYRCPSEANDCEEEGEVLSPGQSLNIPD